MPPTAFSSSFTRRLPTMLPSTASLFAAKVSLATDESLFGMSPAPPSSAIWVLPAASSWNILRYSPGKDIKAAWVPLSMMRPPFMKSTCWHFSKTCMECETRKTVLPCMAVWMHLRNSWLATLESTAESGSSSRKMSRSL
uniref:Putative secreted protein n=1 Tax=Ixodes ricinus TaxID=34613 RepID=A0A6B0USY5_IXORI